NSIFKPASTELKDYKMHIYSSNGTLVFVSNNIEQGWDGTFKGNLQPMGVYVYVVKFTTPNGETRQQKGDLMLIR
ncbi:MAG: gliding motility-associated C-terminal domain-containing protein, partial [Bacteroidales bacterium]|nr:gliding motility-associated C-terminal domain-containing protein [Bacteroidales bacterium]